MQFKEAMDLLAERYVERRSRPATYLEKRAFSGSDILSSIGQNPALSHALIGAGVGAGVGGLSSAYGNKDKPPEERSSLLRAMLMGGLTGGAVGGGVGAARQFAGNVGEHKPTEVQQLSEKARSLLPHLEPHEQVAMAPVALGKKIYDQLTWSPAAVGGTAATDLLMNSRVGNRGGLFQGRPLSSLASGPWNAIRHPIDTLKNLRSNLGAPTDTSGLHFGHTAPQHSTEPLHFLEGLNDKGNGIHEKMLEHIQNNPTLRDELATGKKTDFTLPIKTPDENAINTARSQYETDLDMQKQQYQEAMRASNNPAGVPQPNPADVPKPDYSKLVKDENLHLDPKMIQNTRARGYAASEAREGFSSPHPLMRIGNTTIRNRLPLSARIGARAVYALGLPALDIGLQAYGRETSKAQSLAELVKQHPEILAGRK